MSAYCNVSDYNNRAAVESVSRQFASLLGEDIVDAFTRQIDRERAKREPLMYIGPFIYFIQETASGGIKIGYTGQLPESRLKSLQTSNPNELVLLHYVRGSKENEAELHAHFARDRIRGEWFRPSAELIDYIETLKS